MARKKAHFLAEPFNIFTAARKKAHFLAEPFGILTAARKYAYFLAERLLERPEVWQMGHQSTH